MSKVEEVFPYVTVVLDEQNWPSVIPAELTGLSQRVAVHLTSASLFKEAQEIPFMKEMDKYDFVVEVDTTDTPENLTVLKKLMAQETGTAKINLYMMTRQ